MKRIEKAEGGVCEVNAMSPSCRTSRRRCSLAPRRRRSAWDLRWASARIARARSCLVPCACECCVQQFLCARKISFRVSSASSFSQLPVQTNACIHVRDVRRAELLRQLPEHRGVSAQLLLQLLLHAPQQLHLHGRQLRRRDRPGAGGRPGRDLPQGASRLHGQPHADWIFKMLCSRACSAHASLRTTGQRHGAPGRVPVRQRIVARGRPRHGDCAGCWFCMELWRLLHQRRSAVARLPGRDWRPVGRGRGRPDWRRGARQHARATQSWHSMLSVRTCQRAARLFRDAASPCAQRGSGAARQLFSAAWARERAHICARLVSVCTHPTTTPPLHAARCPLTDAAPPP